MPPPCRSYSRHHTRRQPCYRLWWRHGVAEAFYLRRALTPVRVRVYSETMTSWMSRSGGVSRHRMTTGEKAGGVRHIPWHLTLPTLPRCGEAPVTYTAQNAPQPRLRIYHHGSPRSCSSSTHTSGGGEGDAVSRPGGISNR